MASSSRKFASGVGFSNGWAELTLKKPPPFVPSCLMAICEAAGPTAITCSVSVDFFVLGWPFSSRAGLPSLSVIGSSYEVGCTTAAFAYAPNVWTTPWETRISARTKDTGRRMYRVVRVRSTQKLPTVALDRRANPRIIATSTAMPAAADTKFWTVRPSIWVR